jgi:hypothetical protein
MKQKEILIQEALLKFPAAVSEIEAVDLLAQQLNKEAMAMEDKNSEKYQMAMLKFHKVKMAYRKMVREKEFMVEPV